MRITLLQPGSLMVLMKTCPESWFSAWQDPTSQVSMERVSSGLLLMLPVLLWLWEHPWVLSGCSASAADSALRSFGSLSPPLPFVKCSSPGASGIYTLIQLNPPSKPIKTLHNTEAQGNLSAFRGYWSCASESRPFRCLEAQSQINTHHRLLKKKKIKCNWFDLNRGDFTLKRYELTGI